MIYVPDLTSYECYVVQNDTTIRAYEDIPAPNTTINYRDYFINSSYIYKDGVQTFSNYTTNIPICLSDNVLTDNLYHRNDIDSILIIFVIISFFAFYLPIKLFSKLLKRVK